jgi:N-acetylmuramoyl-L-alanine amidase
MRSPSTLPHPRRSLILALGLCAALIGGGARSQDAEPDPMVDALATEGAARNDWQYIVIHHSASDAGSAAQFDQFHRRKGWDGLAYHFVIDNGKGGPDGHLEVGTRWSTQKHGAHAGHLPSADPEARNCFNEFGIGICLVGNVDKRPPTQAQLETLSRLVDALRTEFDIPANHILGHTHVKGTACPGRQFPWKSLFARLSLPVPKHLHRRPPGATYERCPWCQEKELVAMQRSATR